MIESGVTFDSAQFVMDNEIARMIKHIVGGIRVDDESLAVDDIAAVGAFGDFLSLDATMRHMRELSQPEVLDRRVREDVDAHGREQLRPVAARTVRVRVATEVGLGAVVHGDGDPLLRLLHRLLLAAHDRLDRLERVVDVEELAGVRREALLVLQQRVDAAALLRRAAAVETEDDLVPDVDGAEAC